jgi:hypothetical protein
MSIDTPQHLDIGRALPSASSTFDPYVVFHEYFNMGQGGPS